MKKLIVVLVILGAVGCVSNRVETCGTHGACCAGKLVEVADVKTCGCPKTAACGDCCGPKHCPCNPSF